VFNRFVLCLLLCGDGSGSASFQGDFMKRKPDVMTTLIVVFCLGLVVSGVVSFERSIERPAVQVTMTEAEDETLTR